MTLQRPRRIFRSSPAPRLGPAAGRLVLVGALIVLIAAGAGVLVWRASAWFARVPPAASGQIAADPSQIAVIDAGTLRLGGVVVRLLGVDPPPRGQSCGNVADCGSAAANALSRLVRQKPVTCALHGADGLGRPLAECAAGGTDLSRALVEAGWARAGTELLRQSEAGARADHRGLWASP